MSSKQPTLQQLPDDALILVMKHLAVDDLFTCRLVCKRLGGLALHPEIWLHRRLDEDKPCVCAVLGLAPCLDKVVYSNKVHTRAFTMTRCAVRHLTLDIFQGTECAVAGLALLRQEVLGRLISVRLQVCHSHKDVAPLDDADPLLRTLVACSSGLESLDLPFGLPTAYAMRPVPYGPSKSSLKYFRFEFLKEAETFVNTVLAGHAATLQEVDLGLGPQYFEMGTSQLFVGLAELRRLTCRVFPGMQALASCKMLRDVSLSLFVDVTPVSVVQGAVEFLRLLAGQLRTVSLVFNYAEDDNEHSERLLGALACSGQSLVEQLSIVSIHVPIGALLLRALSRLPALRVLSLMESSLVDPEDVDGVGDILAGITPATAPSLRRLELSTDIKGCLHEWLHRDAVGRVLAANPSLHVHVWGTDGCKVRWQGERWVECDACVLGCHREATGNFEKGRRVGFFSHGPRECAHPEDHVTGDKWTWIHIRCNSD